MRPQLDPNSPRKASASWLRRAIPALAAMALLSPALKAGELYLDFATSGGAYAAGWTPVYAPGGNANVTNVAGSGYNFSFINVGSFQGGDTTQPLTRGGFYDNNNQVLAHTFTLSGLNPGQSVGLYACAAWDGNAAGGYIVYGDSGPAGVKAQTVGSPGTSPTIANLTFIGTSVADGTGEVSGQLYGRNGVGLTGEGQVGAFVFVPVQSITSTAGAHGSISPEGANNVSAGSDQIYTITPDSGYHIVDVLVDSVSIGAVSSYTFSNVQADHTIEANFAVNTFTRTITASAGANGSISPSGTVNPYDGVNQPFTITPDEGYHIDDVVVDGSSVGPAPYYVFDEVSANHTISATFAIDTFTITATAGPGGTIDPAGETVLDYDGSQFYTITPDEGYYISSLLIDGVATYPIDYYSFDFVQADHSIEVTFDNRTRLSLDFAPSGGAYTSGWIRVSETSANQVNVADVGGSGYGFTFTNVGTWDNGNASQPLTRGGFYNNGGTGVTHLFSLTGLTPGQQVTLYACSAWDGVGNGAYVVYGDSGAAGVKAQTVGDPGISPILENLTLIGNAAADATGKVSGAMYGAGGVSSGAQGQLGGMVFAIEAVPTWTISASAGANGSISPSGNVTVDSGASQAFTITPNGGYHVADVLVDGISVGAVTDYTFNVVTADHTISATFAADSASYSITASAGANGAISPSGTVSVFEGVNQPFTITPAPGYHVADVLVDGGSVGAVTNYTFTNVTANHSITASFAINTFAITATAGPNGSISPSGLTEVNQGSDQGYTITPDEGYFVDELFVDGVLVPAAESYDFINVTAAHTISVVFDNRTKLKLDFTHNIGTYANGWTPVAVNFLADTNIDVSDVGGSGYHFTFTHVATWDNGASDQPLTRSGVYNYGGITNDHTFTLSGLNAGQSVTLYASAAWNGNGTGGYLLFGDNAPNGVRAQTIGSPGANPSVSANLTLIGTAVADGSGQVTGSLYGNAGVGLAGEGQVGGFVFAISDGGTPPSSPFNQWAQQNSLTGNDALPGSDPDQDGVSNLIEFAMNADPNSGSSRGMSSAELATVDGQPGVLTLTFAVRAGAVFSADGNRMRSAQVDGVSYTVEASEDLGTWGGPAVTEVTGQDAAAIQSGLPAIGSSDWEYKTFRVSGSSSSAASSFMRVGVE